MGQLVDNIPKKFKVVSREEYKSMCEQRSRVIGAGIYCNEVELRVGEFGADFEFRYCVEITGWEKQQKLP